ncbi:15-hydroxyprostaglandin dehydrogenase [NAD(+)] [Chanos chanos]|uniref:15-hydroxyprostaglandin dehydrogenase [NAD(+)] n=1 Tax=Chanos chanos TaxID=29144 RepID=A0A6J2WXX6_CHACN|nr:15-hydroxyprostaglandin dehydrogenase [NAD(+)]-like [Chanos chanos]
MLNGKVAIVTGAAQGLGRSFCDILLQNGARVALLDVNEVLGKEVKDDFEKKYGPDKTQFIKCDVSKDEDFKDGFQKTVEKFSGVDIVCNNAGIVDEKNWEKTISINLAGVVRGTYLALDCMKKENGGRGGVIVNVASLAGLGPLPPAPIYTATKHGVMGFSRAMAAVSELTGAGVRINILCPSFVSTDLLSTFHQEEKTGQFFCLKDLSASLLEKYGVLEPAVVAKGLFLLVTDESKNGEVLLISRERAAFVVFPKGTGELPCVPVSL